MGDREIRHNKEMAERCEQTAESLPSIEIKRQFTELARQWRELAKHAERPGREERSKSRSVDHDREEN
jgi:hypothetical protein